MTTRRHWTICHCGSDKLPGIRRVPRTRREPTRWCCGVCDVACAMDDQREAFGLVTAREEG